jgi:hypothetical protein
MLLTSTYKKCRVVIACDAKQSFSRRRPRFGVAADGPIIEVRGGE